VYRQQAEQASPGNSLATRKSSRTVLLQYRKVRFMSTATTAPRPSYLDTLEPILTEIIAPTAGEIDRTAAYPQAALDVLAQAGLLGLVSAREVGGLGEGIRAATLVVEQVARHCASTAMVVCMHYAAAAVIEAHGSRTVREA